jgi:hypothetical protein
MRCVLRRIAQRDAYALAMYANVNAHADLPTSAANMEAEEVMRGFACLAESG